MNPIIGTLVNGETTSQQIKVFCLVLGLYLAAWKDKQNLYTYLLIGLVFNAKIRQRKERNCPLKKTLNFRTFSNSQKICQSRSYIAYTLYENYLVFQSVKRHQKEGLRRKANTKNNCYKSHVHIRKLKHYRIQVEL